MKDLCVFISSLFTCSLLLSCDDDIGITQKSRQVGINVSHSVVTIIVCKDAYVEVGGYSDYKGTYCREEIIDLDNSFEFAEGEYEPNGYPKGAGGNGSFSDGNSWYFNFRLLESVYGRSSKLNLLEKDALQKAISVYDSQPSQYLAAYKRLLTNNIKVDFAIDATINVPAQYICENKLVCFQDISTILWSNVAEELLHALQHQAYYGDKMSDKYKNYEFEVYVFRDLAFGIANKLNMDDDSKPFYFGTYCAFDMDNPYYDDYEKWINKIIDYGYFPIGERANFNRFCSYWTAIKGDVLSDFYPQLLRIFFDKPQK